jgi:hypothetical protein
MSETNHIAMYQSLRAEHARIEAEMRRVHRLACAEASQEIHKLMSETGLTIGTLLGSSPRQRKERAPYGSKTRQGKPVGPEQAGGAQPMS